MKTQIQSIHFDATEELQNFIQEKIDKMDKIYNRIESCNIILKLDKNDQAQNKVVEINMVIPGYRLFASDQSETFETAMNRVVEEMESQLHKHKDKMSSNEIPSEFRIQLKGK